MNFLIGCCEKQPIRKLGKRLRSYEKENRSLIPAGYTLGLTRAVESRRFTVKPRYCGHLWDQTKCPYYRASLSSGLILRKMYGVGPRKLSVITSVRIKRVSVKRGFTVVRSEGL